MSPKGQAAFIKGSGKSFGAVGDGTFEAGTPSFFQVAENGGGEKTDPVDLSHEVLAPEGKRIEQAVGILERMRDAQAKIDNNEGAFNVEKGKFDTSIGPDDRNVLIRTGPGIPLSGHFHTVRGGIVTDRENFLMSFSWARGGQGAGNIHVILRVDGAVDVLKWTGSRVEQSRWRGPTE
jgi:hypothetical protein